MDKKQNSDVYDSADRFDEFVGSALSVTKLSDDDVFAREIEVNSLFRASSHLVWAFAIFAPILLWSFDGRGNSIRLWSFDGRIQLAIAAPFFAFCVVIVSTWYLAYRNHVQRIACVKRVPELRRFTVASIACGCAAATTVVMAEVDRFDVYWSTSLMLIVVGYYFAHRVASRFQDTVLDLRDSSRNTPSPVYHYKLEAEKKLQDRSFPLGDAYRGLDTEKLDEYYDRRVRELSYMISISDGWKVSNQILAISLFVMFVVNCVLIFGTEIRREYFALLYDTKPGTDLLIAGYQNLLPYLFELAWMVYFILFGIFAAGLRSRINPTVYGDEAVLCNATEPLEWNTSSIGTQPTSVANPDNDQNKLEMKLYTLLKTGRVIPAVFSGLLLFFVSQDVTYSAAFVVFLAFSFMTNDLFDYLYGKDIICHPSRALPSGNLSVKSVAISALVLFAALVGILFQLPFNQVVALVSGIALSLAYSLVIKRKTPLPGTLIWAACVTITFMAGLSEPVSTEVYLLFGLIFFSREVLLDIRDMDADKEFADFGSVAQFFEVKGALRATGLLFGLSGIGVLFLIDDAIIYAAFLFCLSVALICFTNKIRQPVLERASILTYLGVLLLSG